MGTNMKKQMIAIAAVVAAAGTVQAAELPERIKTAGKVIVANTPNYPPLEYKDPKSGELMGLDIDLGTALAKQLGLTVEWADIGFEQMVPSLSTGRVDLIQSGMSDLPKRRETMTFLDYMQSGAQFYVSQGRGAEFNTLTDFCGKKVGMSRRTSFPDETAKWSVANCEAAGLPAIEVVGTEGSADARAQLKQGRIDAAVQGAETLPYLLDLEKDTYKIVGVPFTIVHQGIGFAKTDEALLEAYKGAMSTIQASGEYKSILEKYSLQHTQLDGVYVNGELQK
jgi:polar amino acid transport system substrate-binding protein